jgi:peroxiredoxin
MRLIIFLLLSSLSINTVFAQKQKFEIKGSVAPSVQGKKLYFTRIKMYGTPSPETTPVVINNGKFTLKGQIDEPESGILSYNQDSKADTASLKFWIDKGNIQVNISDKLKNGKITGSKANAEFNSYLKKTSFDTQEFNEFYEGLKKKAMTGANRDSLQLVFENAYGLYKKSINDTRLSYFKSNPGSFVSLLILPEIAEYSQNYTLTDSLYNLLSSDIKKSPSGKIIMDRFNSEKRLAIGATAPEFSQSDTQGKLVKLSDFRGKYVLLDFWASWCGPCRQENPNVVKVYNEFKDRNFTVLGVSLDRQEAKSAWLKAISDDNLMWTHVSDLNFWKNEAAVLYKVTSIPQNFLLDPQGKIIAKNLRGEDLKSALQMLIK